MSNDAFGYDLLTGIDYSERQSQRDGVYTHLAPLEERLAIAALPPIDKTGWPACEWCGWLEPVHRLMCPACGRFCGCCDE